MHAELEKLVALDDNGIEVPGSARWILLVNGVQRGEPFTDLDAAVEALNAVTNEVPIPFA